MFTACYAISALLAASANRASAALTMSPTHEIKGRPGEELTLKCGDGEMTGEVVYWHTPFMDLHAPGLPPGPAPVHMTQHGGLTLSDPGSLHEGLYYCLLDHAEGSTLFVYQVHVDPEDHMDSEHEADPLLRLRRGAGSIPEQRGAVSDQQLAGAVTASVLLTFVVGFGAGALSRRHVLRCFVGLRRKFLLPWRQQSDSPLHSGPDVVMATLQPLPDRQALGANEVLDDVDTVVMKTPASPSALCPPVKPQRSFRTKEAQAPTPTYLEERDCDDTEEGDTCGGKEEEAEGGRSNASSHPSFAESKIPGEVPTPVQGPRPRPRPRPRVIRLYQYDEDGRRYSHLPDEPVPAPRLKQRSASLTHLNAIMAAASAGERPHFAMEI